jgi:hypothetical protein
MKAPPNIIYRLDAGEVLVRRRDGDLDVDEYEHTCTRRVFEEVAHAMGTFGENGAGTSSHEFARDMGLPFTQVHVAMMFLADCGLIVCGRRRWYAFGDIHLEAMVEFLGLPHREYTEGVGHA